MKAYLNVKLEAVEAGRVKITIRGRTYTVIDEAKKIVDSILWARSFIDVLASNEPHAALVWGGLSTILDVRISLS
jgi:hypothetical protein